MTNFRQNKGNPENRLFIPSHFFVNFQKARLKLSVFAVGSKILLFLFKLADKARRPDNLAYISKNQTKILVKSGHTWSTLRLARSLSVCNFFLTISGQSALRHQVSKLIIVRGCTNSMLCHKTANTHTRINAWIRQFFFKITYHTRKSRVKVHTNSQVPKCKLDTGSVVRIIPHRNTTLGT